MSVRVKPDPEQPTHAAAPMDIAAEESTPRSFAAATPLEVPSSAPVTHHPNAHPSADDTEDEIVREIDVYLSPDLAPHLNLIQYPLNPIVPGSRPLPPPSAARIRPIHNMLELDHPLPTHSFSTQRQLPEPLNLSHRTYVSTNIPLMTHMALGVLDGTGKALNVIPLSKVMQMRPSFGHVDALYDDGTDEISAAEAKAKKDGKKPLGFKKKESDRATVARRTSYAFKKASEESEDWTELEVCGHGTDERMDARRRVGCPSRENTLRFAPTNAGGSAGFVKSLNYLPRVALDEADEMDLEAEGRAVGDENEEELLKELTTKLTTLFLQRGLPIPYSVLRTKIPSVPDEILIRALGSVAVLVRGNFVLQSRLLDLSEGVAVARDLILCLMNRDGFVQRWRLCSTFAKDDAVTDDVIGAILELVGCRCLNGWEMKVDDDVEFIRNFKEDAKRHGSYWERRMEEERFEKLLRKYQQAEDYASPS